MRLSRSLEKNVFCLLAQAYIGLSKNAALIWQRLIPEINDKKNEQQKNYKQHHMTAQRLGSGSAIQSRIHKGILMPEWRNTPADANSKTSHVRI
jgi:hypothetical protein